MIKSKSILSEGHYPVVVGIITMDGQIKSQETDKSHGELNFKRGICWRFNPMNDTLYWHGDSSEHDESDEINVDAHLYKKYGYSVSKNITLEDSQDLDSYTHQHNKAHGLFENNDELKKDVENFRLSLIQKYPQLEDLYFYVASDKSLYISSIRVKLEDRHSGIGKSVIRDIKKFADDHDLIITLSPEPEKRKYTKKLDKFYKDLGFNDNKGRNKDYRLGGAFGRIMYRRPGINEVVDGRGYFTKEKFGSVILSELQRTFPSFTEIELVLVYDGQEFKHEKRRGMRHNRDMKSLADRSQIYNSSLMAAYLIDYNNKEYEVRISNTFKKVPDTELSNKFTMADDEYLKKMPFKSLEPKDLNTPSSLMEWQCRVKREEDDKVLIPKKQGYAILFDDYKTLKDLIIDVKKVIEEDSGFGEQPIIPGIPNIPNAQLVTEGAILIHPQDKKDIYTYLKDMETNVRQYFGNDKWVDGEKLVSYMNKVSNTLESNKFPFNVKYVFMKGLGAGYYDKDNNELIIAISHFSEWERGFDAYQPVIQCYSVDFKQISSTFIHEFTHHIQHTYRKEKSGDYTLPKNWSTKDKYYKRGWERQAHALGYLEKLRQSFNIKNPREFLYRLKKKGLQQSPELNKLKQTDYQSWKEIMKQAAMSVAADMNKREKKL